MKKSRELTKKYVGKYFIRADTGGYRWIAKVKSVIFDKQYKAWFINCNVICYDALYCINPYQDNGFSISQQQYPLNVFKVQFKRHIKKINYLIEHFKEYMDIML
jgi:hypothetical protein